MTISDVAATRLWLSGSVMAVRQLAEAVRELEQAVPRAAGAPLASLVPLAGRLAAAASDVGARFAASPAPASGEDGPAPGLAAPRPGAPAGYVPSMPGRPTPDAARPSPLGAAVAAPDAPANAVPGGPIPSAAAPLAERPTTQPGALAGYARFTPVQSPAAPLVAAFPSPPEITVASPDGRVPPPTLARQPTGQPGAPPSHAPARSSAAPPDAAFPSLHSGSAVAAPGASDDTAPGGHAWLAGPPPLTDPLPAAAPHPTPRDGSRVDAAPRAAQHPDAGITPAAAGDAARALLLQAADALTTARLGAEQATGPAPQDVAAALAHAQRHVGLAALQLAAFSGTRASRGGPRGRRAGEPRASFSLPGSGWTPGSVPRALSRTRRALMVVLLCAAGAATWGATTLDLSAARLACALVLGALGLAGVARLVHQRASLRIRLAGGAEAGLDEATPAARRPR